MRFEILIVLKIKALWKLSGSKTAINGVLTDSVRWRFFRLDANGKDYLKSHIVTKPNVILGLLNSFIRGKAPPRFEFPQMEPEAGPE